jgi:hypothetical protein
MTSKLARQLRSAIAICALLALPATVPASSQASGGTSIADAPTLAYGQVTAGGGLEQEFWRLQLYSGDKVTFIADLGENPEFSREWGFALYAPLVTDYTIRGASAADQAESRPGKSGFFVKSPFSGQGTLDVCEGGLLFKNPCGMQEVLAPHADPYSFTATVTHATSLRISAPTLARSGSSVTVRASVESPAGTPQGSCLIGGRLTALTSGKCAKRVRLGHQRRQTITVRFVGDEGWESTSGNRTIRLLP